MVRNDEGVGGNGLLLRVWSRVTLGVGFTRNPWSAAGGRAGLLLMVDGKDRTVRTGLLLCSLLLAWSLAPGEARAQGARNQRRARADAAEPTRALGDPVRYPIDSTTLGRTVHVRAAPNVPVHLMFPEGWAERPTCGGCFDETEGGTPPADARFVMRRYEQGNYIAIKPRMRSREDGGSGPPSDRFFTLLPVMLKSLPRPITIQVHYERPEEADTLVHFFYPADEGKDALVEKRVAELRAKDEATFVERVTKGANRTVYDMLLATHQCRRVGESKVESLATFEVEELCHFGNKHFVVFKVSNGGNPALYPGTVLVTLVTSKKDEQPVDSHSVPYFERELPANGTLAHRESLRGVVSFELLPKDKARRFIVRWTEGKGQQREIIIPDVSF